MTTTNDTLRGNIEAALRLLLKSEKDYLRRAAEVGIEDLGLLVARLDEKLSVESADAWLAHRFNEVFDEKKRLEEQLEAAQSNMEMWKAEARAAINTAKMFNAERDELKEQLEALREAASRKSFRRAGLSNTRSMEDLAALDRVLASNPATEPEFRWNGAGWDALPNPASSSGADGRRLYCDLPDAPDDPLDWHSGESDENPAKEPS